MSNQFNIFRILRLRRGGYQGAAAAPAKTIEMQNGSTLTLTRGDVVAWDTANSTKDILVCTTVASSGSATVCGMVVDSSTKAVGAICEVQIWGPTKALKVDGTTNIAVGDGLGSFTTAKIASKATTSGRFATALEVYTADDSNGVIGAFIHNENLRPFTVE